MKLITVNQNGSFALREDLQNIVDAFTGFAHVSPIAENRFTDLLWLQEQGNYCFLTTPPQSVNHSMREPYSNLFEKWGVDNVGVSLLNVETVQKLHQNMVDTYQAPWLCIYQMYSTSDGSVYYTCAVIAGDHVLRKYFIDTALLTIW